MCEILFRGKQTTSGEWSCGYTYSDGKKTYIAYEGEKDCIIHEVIPETVGRCTGLTDKNGKEIFEGDILDASWALVGLVVIRFGRYKDVFNTGARGKYGHIGFYAECPHKE